MYNGAVTMSPPHPTPQNIAAGSAWTVGDYWTNEFMMPVKDDQQVIRGGGGKGGEGGGVPTHAQPVATIL